MFSFVELFLSSLIFEESRMNGRIKEGMVDVSSANDDNTSLIAHANTGDSYFCKTKMDT